jgi:hypothetical protein
LATPAGELFGQPAMRRVVLGHQQDAAGEAIQVRPISVSRAR